MTGTESPETRANEGDHVRFPFAAAFGFLWVLWLVAFWPGAHHAWWFCDDYCLDVMPWDGLWRFSRSIGRPVLALWGWTFVLDHDPNNPLANILLRWLQGGFHVLTATLVATMLGKQLRARWAVLAVVPFVVWGFNSDAVLWRGAGINVLASLFSVLGVWAVHARESRRALWGATGVLLLALSMVTTQASAMGGLVAWTAVTGVAALGPQGVRCKALFREGALIGLGYVLGGLLTLAFIKTSSFPTSRAALADNLGDKLTFLKVFNQLFLFHPVFYTKLLKNAHLALGLVTALLILGHVFRGREGWRLRGQSLFSLLCLASLLVLPYLPILAVKENWPTFRNLYNSPLFITACLAVGFALGRHRVVLRLGYLVLFGLVVGPYGRMAWENSAEYVRCERGDRRLLRQLEQFAEAQGVHKVQVLLPYMPVYDWNPHHLKYNSVDSHVSAFTVVWSVQPFIARHARSLQVVDTAPLRELALRQCGGKRPAGEGLFFRIEGTDVVAVCPP